MNTFLILVLTLSKAISELFWLWVVQLKTCDTYRVFTHGIIVVLPIAIAVLYTQDDGVSNTAVRVIKHQLSWFYPSNPL